MGKVAAYLLRSVALALVVAALLKASFKELEFWRSALAFLVVYWLTDGLDKVRRYCKRRC